MAPWFGEVETGSDRCSVRRHGQPAGLPDLVVEHQARRLGRHIPRYTRQSSENRRYLASGEKVSPQKADPKYGPNRATSLPVAVSQTRTRLALRMDAATSLPSAERQAGQHPCGAGSSTRTRSPLATSQIPTGAPAATSRVPSGEKAMRPTHKLVPCRPRSRRTCSNSSHGRGRLHLDHPAVGHLEPTDLPAVLLRIITMTAAPTTAAAIRPTATNHGAAGETGLPSGVQNGSRGSTTSAAVW